MRKRNNTVKLNLKEIYQNLTIANLSAEDVHKITEMAAELARKAHPVYKDKSMGSFQHYMLMLNTHAELVQLFSGIEEEALPEVLTVIGREDLAEVVSAVFSNRQE